MLPTGTIVLWYYDVGPVPDGWHVCNGGAGTPDFRGRFVRASNVANPPGTLGGAFSHSHTFSAGSHYHTLDSGSAVAAGSDLAHNTDPKTISGTSGSTAVVPAFYALDYIMKL